MARHIAGPIRCSGVQIEAVEPGALPTHLPKAFTLENQPTLGPGDAGFVGLVTDFGHTVYWNGAMWQPAPGDISAGTISLFGIPPSPASWWQLCDGTQVSYLVSGGATLTTDLFTTPDLVSTERFIKTLAVYTGNVQAAVGGGLTGATDAEASHTHSVTTSNHTHTFSGTTDIGGDGLFIDGGSTTTVNQTTHTHPFSGTTASDGGETVGTGAGSSHSHGAGSLAGDGTARPPSIGLMPYFRR